MASQTLRSRTSSPPATVSLRENRGDGSFRAKVDYRAGAFPRTLVISDLSGDGRPDLAIANSDVNLVRVLLSTPGPRIR
jgi:hypothetical protein